MEKVIDQKKDERIYYIDLLRIFCALAVVILHVAAGGWYKGDINTFSWKVFTTYDSLFRFAVPVFFMISGALMLGTKEELSLKKLYLKNIKKLLIIFAVWVLFYAVFYWFYYGRSIDSFTSIIDIIRSVGDNQYQLWFLPPLITLYMIMPILKEIIKDRKVLKYFLILFFIFSICKSTSLLFIGTGAKLKFINLFTPGLVTGYQGYVLLGYYLFTENMSEKNQKTLNILGIISVILTSVLTIVVSLNTNSHYDKFFGYLMLNTFFVSAALFNSFKYKFEKIKFSEKSIKIIKKLSDCTLGVYIFHVLFIDLLGFLNISAINFNPLFSVPIISLLVFGLSLGVTFIFKKIPFLGKFLV